MQPPRPTSPRSFVLGALVASACIVAGYELHEPAVIAWKSAPRSAHDLTPTAGVTGTEVPFAASERTQEDETPPEPTAPSTEEALSAREITERALGFTVSVRAGRAYGAGALVAPGVILTARHVLEGSGADPIQVRFRDSDWLEADLLGEDASADLALLRVDSGERAVAPLASALSLSPADGLMSVGSPQELGFTVHRGIVSYVGRRFGMIRYVQTDLPANPGSSGGPVIDERGRMVGVMAFVLRESEGLAFATPIDYARPLFAEAGIVESQLARGVTEAEQAASVTTFEAWRDADLR